MLEPLEVAPVTGCTVLFPEQALGLEGFRLINLISSR